MRSLTLAVKRYATPSHLVLLALAFSSVKSLRADAAPKNLANGLYDIVVANQAQAPFQHSLVRKPTQADRILKNALSDKQGRVMVDIHLDGTRSIAVVHKLVSSRQDCTIVAVDRSFQAGTVEAYMTPAAAAELATQPGIASLALVWKPRMNVGAVTKQGFVQHRVAQIANKYDGTGIKIAVLSGSFDSFGANGITPDATADISTGDLPGPGNPDGNTTPVTVLEDDLWNGADMLAHAVAFGTLY